MNRNYKIFLILAVILVGVVGYFAYTQYNISKTQEYLSSSQEIKNNATNYFNQASNYEKSGDYSNAILNYQKCSDEINQALYTDKQALNYANGVYREYLDIDIQLLEKTANLLDYKIYQNQYYNNSLNPGQEKANPALMTPYIANLTSEVASLKDKEAQTKNTHPEAFRFLG
ncbi:MAG TPA: hypothetical protein VMC48_01745 [Methanobacterium sp.]|nr:hypothetical protein [Methanobacterium sp.]